MQSQHTSVDSARLLHRTVLLATLALVAIAAASPAWAAATATPVVGEIRRITLDDPLSHWSGGTMVVGGQVVVVPRNPLVAGAPSAQRVTTGTAVPPDASRQISIESSGGATRLGVPVTVR